MIGLRVLIPYQKSVFQHVYCGDWIFSGHTMILILAYLIVVEYSPRYFESICRPSNRMKTFSVSFGLSPIFIYLLIV